MKHLQPIFYALKLIFAQKIYTFALVLLTGLTFGLLIYIPVSAIPGNDWAFQLSLMRFWDFVFLVTLSIFISVQLIFNFYIFKNGGINKDTLLNFSKGGSGTVWGILVSVFGATTCVACFSPLLSFLGLGGILLLAKYRSPILIVSLFVVLGFIYLTSLKVLGVCKQCQLKGRAKGRR